MPTYSMKCTSCDNIFERLLTFAQFDEVKITDDKLWIDCPNCPNNEASIIYDIPIHGHVVNSNNIGVYAEKNAKKIGKVKIEEEKAKNDEVLKPKAEEDWYGRLPQDKSKEIFKSRKSKEERAKIAKDYILNGR